jgi:hypothetical protein
MPVPSLRRDKDWKLIDYRPTKTDKSLAVDCKLSVNEINCKAFLTSTRTRTVSRLNRCAERLTIVHSIAWRIRVLEVVL